MSIEIGLTPRVDDGYVVVEARGDIDLGTQAQFTDALSNAIAAGVALVVVDLTGVQFFAVAGVNCVEQAAAAIHARGGALRLVCLDHGLVWRVLCLLNLDRQWPVHREVAEAVRSAPACRSD